MPVLAADLTYINGKFERGVAIDYDAASGRITRVLRGADQPGAQRLDGRALMPGFINAHSHAFQRLIRGRTQWRPVGSPPADFWSWRESMYSALLPLTPEDVFDVSRFCFLEMLRAGYTSVGEFHYLQTDPDGKIYDHPLELHGAVLAAAEDVGIRIVLINTAYATGGVQRPLQPLQRRFNTPDLDLFLTACEQLRLRVQGAPSASMAIAPHSIRAVPREWLQPIHKWAADAQVPMHMHVSEQMAEVEACMGAYGRRPFELLDEAGVLDHRFTAIHATHVAMNEIALIARARATVCACPSTERDLGDGFLQANGMHAAGVRLAIGTDSQSIIDPFEELRLIEYHERLRRNERVLLSSAVDGQEMVAPTLLRHGARGGAHALQLDAGEIAAGKLADFVAVDLDHIQVAGASEQTLDASLVMGANASVVTNTWVGGRELVSDRRHGRDEKAYDGYSRVARQTARA